MLRKDVKKGQQRSKKCIYLFIIYQTKNTKNKRKTEFICEIFDLFEYIEKFSTFSNAFQFGFSLRICLKYFSFKNSIKETRKTQVFKSGFEQVNSKKSSISSRVSSMSLKNSNLNRNSTFFEFLCMTVPHQNWQSVIVIFKPY